MNGTSIYTTDDWDILSSHPDIREGVCNYLKTHNGATLKHIHQFVGSQVSKDIDYSIFEEYMLLWSKHYTTFFQRYGRIIGINIEQLEGEKRWFHLDKDHRHSRSPNSIIRKYLSNMY